MKWNGFLTPIDRINYIPIIWVLYGVTGHEKILCLYIGVNDVNMALKLVFVPIFNKHMWMEVQEMLVAHTIMLKKYPTP